MSYGWRDRWTVHLRKQSPAPRRRLTGLLRPLTRERRATRATRKGRKSPCYHFLRSVRCTTHVRAFHSTRGVRRDAATGASRPEDEAEHRPWRQSKARYGGRSLRANLSRLAEKGGVEPSVPLARDHAVLKCVERRPGNVAPSAACCQLLSFRSVLLRNTLFRRRAVASVSNRLAIHRPSATGRRTR